MNVKCPILTLHLGVWSKSHVSCLGNSYIPTYRGNRYFSIYLQSTCPERMICKNVEIYSLRLILQNLTYPFPSGIYRTPIACGSLECHLWSKLKTLMTASAAWWRSMTRGHPMTIMPSWSPFLPVNTADWSPDIPVNTPQQHTIWPL